MNEKIFLNDEKVSFCHGLSYTCYEIGHTWTPSCYLAAWQTAKDSFKFSIKVYCTFYGVTGLLKLLKKKNRKNLKKFLLKEVAGVLQSSIFLSSNGTFFMIFFCIYRHLFKKFYRWHGALAGFSTGFFSIMLERKARRGPLATYCCNLALETIYKMAKTRNYVKGVNNGEVFIFSIASAGFMTLFRTKDGLSKWLQSSLEFILGKNESENDEEEERRSSNESTIQKIDNFIQEQISILSEKFLPQKHVTCKHNQGCLFYVLEGIIKQFVVGYFIEVFMNIIQRLRSGRLKPIFTTPALAFFLSTYVGLFRFSNCLLRWVLGRDLPSLLGAISGLIASPAFFFYKSTTIALYFLCKLIEVICCKLVAEKYISEVPHFDVLMYSSALAVILSAAWLEPHNIRPGYWKFLLGVSGYRFPLMFRKILSEFLPDQNTLYINYIPNLKEKYIQSTKVLQFVTKFGKIM